MFVLAAYVCTTICPQSAEPAPGSEADWIREELRQLKQDYEQRIRALEDRLKRLETTSAVPTTTNDIQLIAGPSSGTTAKAAARARQFAEQEFQRDTESRERALLYDRGPVERRVEQVLQDFMDIHGYFRAGYGRDGQGGSQVGFQAPGALAKYRLGNEAENYGELTFGKNFYVPDWDDEFLGQVGGNDYRDANEGLTYGVQMEAWW